jgi:hypothetical protein
VSRNDDILRPLDAALGSQRRHALGADPGPRTGAGGASRSVGIRPIVGVGRESKLARRGVLAVLTRAGCCEVAQRKTGGGARHRAGERIATPWVEPGAPRASSAESRHRRQKSARWKLNEISKWARSGPVVCGRHVRLRGVGTPSCSRARAIGAGVFGHGRAPRSAVDFSTRASFLNPQEGAQNQQDACGPRVGVHWRQDRRAGNGDRS